MAVREKRVPLLVAAAGIVVGIAVTVALVATGALSTSGNASGSAGKDASEELVAAYRRSLESSYTVEGNFTRTMPDGRTLESGILIAQRPPDHIRRQFGGVSGALGGRTLICSTGPDGHFSCAPGAATSPYADDVDHYVETMQSYFAPESPPLYRATKNDDGCFELTLLRSIDDPSYGTSTTMCFDDATGAMTTFELHREGGSIDRIDAITVRAPVPEDFDISQNDAYNQRNDDVQGADVQTPTTPVTPTSTP